VLLNSSYKPEHIYGGGSSPCDGRRFNRRQAANETTTRVAQKRITMDRSRAEIEDPALR